MRAELIKNITEEFDIQELSTTMPYSSDEIDGFISMTNFDWDQFEVKPSKGEPVDIPKKEPEESGREITCPHCLGKLKLNINGEVETIN